MSKKVIIVISAIVIVILVVGVVLFIIQKNSSNTASGTATTGTLPPVSVSTSTQTPSVAAPTSTTITLGTSQGSVTMNNFYQTAQTITQDQQAVIIENSGDYAITYNVPDSSFAIAILSTPLEAARQAAESAFLSELGISKQDACKLTVYEGVPIGVSDQYPGESFPLSFCGGPPTL
jgi:hypothetical protein